MIISHPITPHSTHITDFAELSRPPVFSYGFYLPQTILIFIICIVYSVLRYSWRVALSGLLYFVIGRFVHKYQLLYAMNHHQHSTGRGWLMMCNRVLIGVVLFQLTMAGQLALKTAVKRSLGVLPLLAATIWFCISYNRTYRPLINFIALKSIRRAEHATASRSYQDDVLSDAAIWRSDPDLRRAESEPMDEGEGEERPFPFINPNLTSR